MSSTNPATQAGPQVSDNNAPVEVDHTIDSESAYSDELSAYSASVTSSVANHEWKHGRRYHAYRAGAYRFPSDEKEQDRLDMFHEMFTTACGGRLHFAPFNPAGARILDIGTGTGIWAIDVGDRYPTAALVRGNDLSPIQPSWVPPNVKFLVDDVETEWVVDGEGWDYIHCRYMCAAIADWPRLVRRCIENLRPGGWVEFQDFDREIFSDDGSLPAQNRFKEFYDLLGEAMSKPGVGKDISPGSKLERWVKEAGFINVEHRTVKFPIGTWPKDKTSKQIGAYNALQYLEGIEAFVVAPFTQLLGWKKEEVDVFCAQVRAQVKDRSLHCYYQFHIVWGQKPA